MIQIVKSLLSTLIARVAKYPAVSVLFPAEARKLLDGLTLGNREYPSGKARVKQPHIDKLAQVMTTPSWSPEDHAPVVIAQVDGESILENGEHRLRAVAGLTDGSGVRMLVRLKRYQTREAYRLSYSNHDSLSATRGYSLRATAAQIPMPVLGNLAGGGTGWPPMAVAAWTLVERFGETPVRMPKTLETWAEVVVPQLRAQMEALSESSNRPGAYKNKARRRLELTLYRKQSAALLLEFFRVDPEAADRFMARLLGQGEWEHKHSDTVRKVAEYAYTQSALVPQDREQGAFEWKMQRRLLNAWYGHLTGRAAKWRVQQNVARVPIQGSKLIWWPGSTDKPPRILEAA